MTNNIETSSTPLLLTQLAAKAILRLTNNGESYLRVFLIEAAEESEYDLEFSIIIDSEVRNDDYIITRTVDNLTASVLLDPTSASFMENILLDFIGNSDNDSGYFTLKPV